MKLVWLLFFLVVLTYNTIYDFLPDFLQSKSWVRIINIIAALVLVYVTAREIITNYLDESHAIVSSEGKILKRKNFKWNIHKTTDTEGKTVFIIQERLGDATDVNVTLDRPVKFETYNSMKGVAIRFFCKEKDIPQLKIEIRK